MTQLTILCSGQGAQSPDLFSRFPFTEKGLAIKQSILDSGCLSPEVAEWLVTPEIRPSAIFQNHFSQPLLCLYQSMIWAEVAGFLPRPSLIAGYSLGELSAYGCAGALSPEEIVKLASRRANLMDNAGPQGELLAVRGLPPSAMSAVEGAHVAIIIAEDHFVVGCLAEQAPRIAEALSKAGAREVTPLAVSVASHTAILDGAVAPFRSALTSVTWNTPQIPILAGINAAKVMRREQMEQLLPEQIHRTIRWDLIQQRFMESGCRVLLEIGPGRQLAHMAASRGLEARSVEEFRSPEGVASWVENALRRAG
jgi:[acyl-carrier-protein] S-malonyltransferase